MKYNVQCFKLYREKLNSSNIVWGVGASVLLNHHYIIKKLLKISRIAID
ncbi:hypothetical protein [Clostridium botulinum]|nr:hypothetical protein [Clostridium botulinum]